MEFSTFTTELKSSEVKPSEDFAKYISLLAVDIEKVFLTDSRTTCPSCGYSDDSHFFERIGVKFRRCSQCLSVYCLHDFTPDKLTEFYQHSASRLFWYELEKKTHDVRIQKTIYPLIQWLEYNLLDFDDLTKISLLNVNPIHSLFAQEWSNKGREIAVYNPLFSSKDNYKGNIINSLENQSFDAVTLFQALDRSINPKELLNKVFSAIKPGGYCFITSILSTGLDSLVLEEKLPTLLPPERYNCFSFEGLKNMVEEVGFKVIEFSTPGELDVENIEFSYKNKQKNNLGLFWEYIFTKRENQTLLKELQKFLQMHRLSSMGRLVLQKG